MQIVTTLAAQLDGRVVFGYGSRGGGAGFEITFAAGAE